MEVIYITGTARGIRETETVWCVQKSVVEEQVNTAKRRILERFASKGISETEVSWQFENA